VSVAKACLLCGHEGPGVSIRLVDWAEPLGGRAFETLPRCFDAQACRARVEAAGDRWEVRDATVPTVEPMASPEPTTAVAGPAEAEVPSWLP